MVGEFPDGVWLVELAPLIDAALVASSVASAIGAPPSPGIESAEVVCRFLAHRRALVVLDNCEHVIDTAAALVDRLLEAAPRAQVLATSREPLDVAGESVWRVPSLSVDADGGVGDAVALFVERAAHARPGFALDDTNRDAVIQVCRRLDGIPLALELAAARAKVMSVEQIASRLDERFRLLTRGGRTAVPRQQTLQGAIDWSYELLAAAERELFDVLGVFAGDFDLGAAAAVAGSDEFEVLDLIEQLTDKSMVEADPFRDRYCCWRHCGSTRGSG
jgi:predicted ATPase